ncbi:hypothetical protein NFA_23560 [Nocardia farcinica IFM 10152]|uniref:Type-5 uracil-DNA glycosylase n=1 Tax=Nocardia farcinica (strain IFM 10152) TaxID=247156 RepID=Q5YX88_NOCFA|nr:hypothetical protein NFA_23560 [Nocardia farcinica IFM 10152]
MPSGTRPPPVPRAGAAPARARYRSIADLDADIAACRACPRLVRWRELVAETKRAAFRDETYWGRPVPGFGPDDARLLLVGLAPAAHGGNRTGRMFTGDRSGDVLFAALHAVGLANQPTAVHPGDGLRLLGARVTAPVHCAPPDNKPTVTERDRCRGWLDVELGLLAPTVRAIVVLGGFGWQALLPALAEAGWAVPRPPEVRARGAGAAGTGRRGPRAARAVRLLPRQPAEHLHRQADPGDARSRAGRGRRRRRTADHVVSDCTERARR